MCQFSIDILIRILKLDIELGRPHIFTDVLIITV